MNREDAEARAATLNETRDEPARWFARERVSGEWEVVRVDLPGGIRGPLKETTEARPRPPTADDPALPNPNIAPGG